MWFYDISNGFITINGLSFNFIYNLFYFYNLKNIINDPNFNMNKMLEIFKNKKEQI